MKILVKVAAIAIAIVALILQVVALVGDYSADPIYTQVILLIWLSYLLSNIANEIKS